MKDILHYDPFYLAHSLLAGKPFSGQSVNRRTITRQQEESDAEGVRWVPLCDIKEDVEHFVLYAEIPGVDPSKIEVLTDEGNRMLTIRGERHLENEKDSDFNLVERMSGPFKRQFILPDTADAEQITASGSCGVLKVTIKKKAKAQPKKIVVDAQDAA